jgi:hypothetical protein
MLHISAFMLGHHQAYKNVETWLMNCTHFTSIWIHIDIALHFALILQLKLSNKVVNKHDLSQFKACLMGGIECRVPGNL